MPISPRALPPWRRPVRIPEAVGISHAEPAVMEAGSVAAWRMPFTLSKDVPGTDELWLQLWGGRNNRGGFAGIQLESPEKPGFLQARLADGSILPIRAPSPPGGSFRIVIPGSGLPRGTVLTVSLGDPAVPGSGVKVFPIHRFDKFFVLSVSAPAANAAAVPAWSGGSVWGEANWDRIVACCTCHVIGGAASRLRAYVPAFVNPGRPVTVLIRAEDRFGNLSPEEPGAPVLSLNGSILPAAAEPVPGSSCLRARVSLPGEGVFRLHVRDTVSGLEAETNPVVCSASAQPAYWGMIHGHTEMSDGVGAVDHYFHQLKNEVLLDFGAVSDHDHRWETPDRFWEITMELVKRWHEPGSFVTFPGYEWAKWRQNGDGDRNVYYLHDDRPLYRSDDGDYPSPPDLFRALRDAREQALVIPHHTAHGGNFCDWKNHSPEHERLVEIFQVRGSFECGPEDNPVPEKGGKEPFPGGYVRNALALGWRVGFTAGGDDHAGQWGTEAIVSGHYKQGLMSVEAEACTREALFEALRQRRVTATTGPRMLLTYRLDGQPMGSELNLRNAPGLAGCRRLDIRFHGTAPMARIDIIRNNVTVHSVTGTGSPDAVFSWEDRTPLAGLWLPPALHCGHPFLFYYVRAVQADGEVAWASPVWLDEESDQQSGIGAQNPLT